ncbi:MAG TPA: hypothetical protein VF519_00150 [Mycobacteriales bacterium]
MKVTPVQTFAVLQAPVAYAIAALPTDVGPGVPLSATWPPVAGATGAEVTEFTATLTPAAVDEDLGTLSVSSDKGHVVTLPAQRAVRRLVLNGLRRADGTPIRSEAELGAHRLAVSVATGGDFGPALFSVRTVSGGALQPAFLAGASLSAGNPPALRLPDTPAKKVRVSLVRGETPEDFEVEGSAVDSIGVVAAALPADLTVTGPDGATAWASPGEVPASAPPLRVDLRIAAETAIAAAVAEGKAPAVTFTLKGRAKSHVYLAGPTVHGALLRSFPGVLTTSVAGAPVPVSGIDRLAAEAPSSVRGDLTVRYDGLRLLPSSDAAPAAFASVSGPVVSPDRPVAVRAFPAAGWGADPLARVGIVGRATAAAALSVSVVAFERGEPGEPLDPPGVVRVEPSGALSVVWVDLPAPLASPGTPTALAVRATEGTFLWAAAPDGRPLARFAVRDEDPAPAALTLDGATLRTVGAAGLHEAGAPLPAKAFAGDVPVLDCPLFVSVDLSDLLLRYAR